MVKATINVRILPDHKIKYSQYQKVFAKAFLKGAVMNIYYYMRKIAERSSGEEPNLLTLLKYQRGLVIGGLKKREKTFGVDGQNVVQCLFNRRNNSQDNDNNDYNFHKIKYDLQQQVDRLRNDPKSKYYIRALPDRQKHEKLKEEGKKNQLFTERYIEYREIVDKV